MSSAQHEAGRKAPRPDFDREQSSAQSDTIEIEELDDDSEAEDAPQQQKNQKPQAETETPQDEASEPEPEEPEERPKTPAYVAPIGKIGPISPISRPAGISAPQDRLRLPEYIGRFLVGKKVNEDGDIVDGESHQILARAGGDLPSIIGRAVANWEGDILGDDGELLGWIDDLELGRPRGSPTASRAPKSLFELMGQRTAGLMVDQHQNLIDPSTGKVLGTYFDNNNPQHRKEKEEREAKAAEGRKKQKGKPREQRAKSSDEPGREEPPTRQPLPGEENEDSQAEKPSPRRSESERRQNAESWRKENPGESPSDIFLDVKSTTEGIQLTIRIPTVFGGQQVKPNISFS